jgi:hypothetical protein
MYGRVEVQFHTLLTLALDRGEWLASHPRERAAVCIWQEANGSQSWSGHSTGKEKSSLPLAGIEPWSSSPQPNHYTDWDIQNKFCMSFPPNITSFWATHAATDYAFQFLTFRHVPLILPLLCTGWLSAYPASCTMGTMGSIPGGKAARAWS